MTPRLLPVLAWIGGGLLAAAPREGNTTVAMPPAPPGAPVLLENAFPSLTFSSPLCLRSPAGETTRLFVCEKDGDLELIPDVTAGTPAKTVFLDVDGIVNARPGEVFLSNSEQGLLAAAFHPDYETNGLLFTVYNVRVGGLDYQRLSRWHDPDRADTTADPASEQVLIQMRNEAGNHNGGDLHFGPDGYLYMSWGDEGAGDDSFRNAQFIDKDFWSSIMRIDVDLEAEDGTPADGTGSDDANLPPNDHPAIIGYDGAGNVVPGGDPLYEVPADNPWVGATEFNGIPVNATQVRTEFFAVGFRNPWRFSFDSLTGELWVGDVGQWAWEEVATVLPGSNHGWSWFEGDAAGSRFSQTINGASRTDATLTFPEWDYPRGAGPFEGRSVTGGLVHRGHSPASLYGAYLFADYNAGNIWSLRRTGTPGEPQVERITGEGGIAGFGTDPSNGDLLLADLGGQIRRLVAGAPDPAFPATLSATGIFADLATLAPEAGVVPYDINLPFWSDHARKQRWFVIPNTSDQVGYDRDAPWSFPEGMVWVKHFELDLTRGDPATARRLETRVLVKTADGAYGVSYRWNAEQTEAFLADEAGEDIDLTIDTGTETVSQRWRIPSQAECRICHTPEAGHALSFHTRQLNRDGTLGGASGNFLTLLHDAGYLDTLPEDPATLPRHVRPDEDRYSLEARVRSYLDVNCANCHRQPSTTPTAWLANHHLTLAETGLINAPSLRGPLHPDDRLVVPAQPDRSILLSRVAATNGYGRMPPLGSTVPDEDAISLLTSWITQEAAAPLDYQAWRLAYFGDTAHPDGDPTADPDRDGADNESEWLSRTDPTNGTDTLLPVVRRNGGILEVEVPALAGRGVLVQRSDDLTTWVRWDVAGNDGVPLNPAAPHALGGTPVGAEEFFRFLIRER